VNERRLTLGETAVVAACIGLAAIVMLVFGCSFVTMLSFGVTWLVEDAGPAVAQWAQEKPSAGDMVALGGLVLVLVLWRLRERRQAR